MIGCCLVGPGHHGGVGRPHLGLPSHLSRVSLIQNFPCMFIFPLASNLGVGRPLSWFKFCFGHIPGHVHRLAMFIAVQKCVLGDRPIPLPHTWKFLCPELQRQENIKCRGPAGGNTPAGLKHIYFTKGSFFIHIREGKLISLGTFTLIKDKEIKTN